jgi:hypothetical protein
MIAKLDYVARVHRNICAEANCSFLDKLNYSDPCIGCPEGHFGVYQVEGCEDRSHVNSIVAPSDARDTPAADHLLQPGDLFSTIILNITGKSIQNCGVCRERKRAMNKWGWWKCWLNRKIIIGWLCEEAAKRGHGIGGSEMLGLFKAAFRELRAKRKIALPGAANSERQSGK